MYASWDGFSVPPPLPIELIERPFYERYPDEFKNYKDGASIFSEAMYLNDLHETYLPTSHFSLLMTIPRYPRYTNKRCVDPHIKTYLDQQNIVERPEWGLPVPNEEAAYISLSKYAKDIQPMSEEQVQDMNLAWQWTAQHFGVYMANSRVRTLEEVIPQLDMSTSSGAPFNIKYPTKKQLFTEYPRIKEWLEQDWDTLSSDPNYTFLFTSSLKEEVRPIEKIEKNKIRTFLAGAVDGTVHGNRLFADMNEKMNASYLCSSSAVGMSPYKGNWDRMYRKLKAFRLGYALDESEYDSSLRVYLMWGCGWLRWQMLRDEDKTPENLIRIQTYYRNLVNSLIVTAAGVLVFKKTGNPSGSVNTINDNTLILYCLMAYAWIRNGTRTYSEFEDNTSKILVGDDNTWTVSDWAHRFYNANTVIKTWKDLGITTTTDSLIARSPEELDFLSAHTIFIKDQAVPLYDRNKLMTTLLYAPRVRHTPAVTLQRTAALLTVGWTDTQYRRFSRQLISWLIEKFDKVCAEDPNWIIAKTGILTDAKLTDLFLGETTLYQQCASEMEPVYSGRIVKIIFYLETQERLIKLNKSKMSKRQQHKKNQGRGGHGAKATPQKKLKFRKKLKVIERIRPGMTHLNFPPGAKFVGWGDYNETKGRKLYDKRKAKKAGGKKKGKTWWDTAGDLAGIVGPMLGKAAMTALTGFGDYDVNSNSVAAAVTGGALGGEIPLMENSKHANIMHHREYIGPVNGSTAPFTIQQTFALNPGLYQTFPWLAPIANCYTRYRLRGAVVCYEPTASDYSTTGALGFVALGTQYNPLDAPFNTKLEMLNHEFTTCEKISVSQAHPIECAPGDMAIKEYYIRDTDPPANADLRFYDLAKFSVATGGNPTNTQIGDLWVTFEVEFYQPKIATNPAYPTLGYSFFESSTSTYSHPLNGMGPVEDGNLGITLFNTGANDTDYIQFPVSIGSGAYLIMWAMFDGSSTIQGLLSAHTLITPDTNSTYSFTYIQNNDMTGSNNMSSYNEGKSYDIKGPSAKFFVNATASTLTLPFTGGCITQLMIIRLNPNDGLIAKPVRHPCELKTTPPDCESEEESSEEDITASVVENLRGAGLLQTPEQREASENRLLEKMMNLLAQKEYNNNRNNFIANVDNVIRGTTERKY